MSVQRYNQIAGLVDGQPYGFITHHDILDDISQGRTRCGPGDATDRFRGDVRGVPFAALIGMATAGDRCSHRPAWLASVKMPDRYR
jgi:hypothetical protein